jgi:fructose-1,6-bisphosphatase/sedoheptulose 1,7-bisphosphatase-like protein
VGRATSDGFYIYGKVPTEKIRESAAEGLARLKQGESQLAVSPLCGTNLAVAGILAGLASLLALGNRSRWERAPNVLMAAVVAVVGAQPLGRLVQRYVTTSPDVQDLEIVEVTGAGRRLALLHKVKTAFRAG